MPVLRIDIAAQFASFQDSLNRMESSAARSARNIQSAFGGVKSLIAGLGAGLTVGGFSTLIKSSIDAADNLRDLQKVTGVAANDLLVLQGAAQRSGADVGAIGDVASKLSARLVDAAKGTGDAADAFKALGINVKNSDGSLKNVNQILTETGKAFSGFGDGANKSALAVAALGKGGDKLIPTIEAIEETNARFKELGITITQDVLDAADKFNDTMSDVKSVTGVLITQITADLLPSLQNAADVLLEFVRNTDGIKTSIDAVIGPIKIFAVGFLTLGTLVAAASEKIVGFALASAQLAKGNLSGAFDEIGIAAQKADARMASLANTVSKLFSETAEQGKAMAAALASIKLPGLGNTPGEAARFGLAAGVPGKARAPGLADAEKKTTTPRGPKQKDEFAELLKKAADARTKAAIDQIRALEDKEKDGIKAAEDFQKALDALIGDTPIEQAKKMQESIDFLNKALELGRISPEVFSQAIDKLVGSLEAVDEVAKRAGDAADSLISQTPIERAKELQATIDELNRRLQAGIISADQFEFAMKKSLDIDTDIKKTDDAMKDLGATFSSAFEDAIVGGKSFKDILGGLEKDIIRIATRKLITEPLANAATDFLKDGAGGGIGALFGKIFTSADGNIMTASGPRALRRYARGGITRGLDVSVSGEDGPEAIIPLPDGRSVPVKLQGAGGGMTVYQSFNIPPNMTRQGALQVGAEAQRGLDRAARNL